MSAAGLYNLEAAVRKSRTGRLMAVLYANFFGSVVIVWAILRLRSGMVWMGR